MESNGNFSQPKRLPVVHNCYMPGCLAFLLLATLQVRLGGFRLSFFKSQRFLLMTRHIRRCSIPIAPDIVSSCSPKMALLHCTSASSPPSLTPKHVTCHTFTWLSGPPSVVEKVRGQPPILPVVCSHRPPCARGPSYLRSPSDMAFSFILTTLI
jgi:hypothetical protein